MTGQPTPTGPRGALAAPRARGAAGVIDLAAVAALLSCAVVGFGPSFAGAAHLRAGGGALLLGLVLAWLGARYRWSVLTLAAATVGAYLALGGALAVPGTTIAGVVPTFDTLRTLVLGAVTAWKGLLTVTPPVDAFPELLVVPLLATLVVAVLSGSIALRARRPSWAVLPAAVLLVGVILLGTSETVQPLVQGTVFGLVALTWSAWRRYGARAEALQTHGTDAPARVDAGRLRARRIRNAIVMLGATALVAGLAAPALLPQAHRHVLRDVVEPPLDLREYPSPLVGFRAYVKEREETVLFTVAGLPEGERLRLAVLDAYTGTVLDTAGGDPNGPSGSGAFGRVGDLIPVPPNAPPSDGTVEIAVEIAEYEGVWLPSVGRPTSITFDGERARDLRTGLYLNPETGAALTTAGLLEGDRYVVVAERPSVPAGSDLAGLRFAERQLPAPERVPQAVGSVADTFTKSASTSAEIAAALAGDLASGGVFSSGLDGHPPSRAGHGADRIGTLLTGRQMVGDDEQFAVTMALMARSLGIPARVVMGFYPDAEVAADPAGRYEIRGADVHAWVEVAYQDGRSVRWVPYDPTPDEDQPPQEQDPRSQSEPEPQVLQEPPPPEEPAEAPLAPIPEAAEDETEAERGVPWTRYLGLAAAVGVPLIVLLAPFVAIATVKARRRRRRRSAAVPADRVSGGWREVVDAAVDLGAPVAGGATRRETARGLAERYPGTRPLAVAERADAAVFGAGEPSDADVEAFWAEVDGLVTGMSSSVGRWQRLKGRFSVRSLTHGSLTRGGRPAPQPTSRGGRR